MTKHDAKLHPGEFFLERQVKPDGEWEFVCRDNDEVVMRTRFEYWCSLAKLHTGVRLYDPNVVLVEEFFQKGVLIK